MKFNKVILLLLAIATSQLSAMENDNKDIIKAGSSTFKKNDDGSLTRVNPIVRYKYPILLGSGIFAGGSLYSYIQGTLKDQWKKITGYSVGATVASVGLQMLCSYLFTKKPVALIQPKTEELPKSILGNNNNIMSLNNTQSQTANLVTKYSEFEQYSLEELIKTYYVTPTADVKEIMINKAKKQDSTNFLFNLVYEFANAVENKQSCICFLNKITPMISNQKMVYWNEEYKTAKIHLTSYLQSDIQALRSNSNLMYRDTLLKSVLAQDNACATELITSLYNVMKHKQPGIIIQQKLDALCNYFDISPVIRHNLPTSNQNNNNETEEQRKQRILERLIDKKIAQSPVSGKK